MPVLVTGADTVVGHAAVRGLLRTGGEIRVYVDAAAADAHADGGDGEQRRRLVGSYRAAGCKVARGTLVDEGRLELAMEQVHTVVHLAGGPLDPPDRVVDEFAVVLSAAIGAGCRRLVWTSHLGADVPDGEYLAACAEAEALLADAPLDTVVLRRALTYGPGDALTEALAAGAAWRAAQAQHAPLWADDLGAAVAAADRARGQTGDPHTVLTLTGPQVLGLDEFCALLSAGSARARRLPDWTMELLARDALPQPDAIGRHGTAPAEGAALLAAAS